MDKEEKIQFAIRGPGVDDSLRLDEFDDIVGAYRQILDRTYLSISGRKRFSKGDREQFAVTLVDWKHGSVLMDLAVVAVPLLQGYIELVSGQSHFLTISEVTELAYKFLKARIEQFFKSGREPHVEIVSSPNAHVFLNVGNGTIQVTQNIVEAANATEPHFRKLTSHIDGKRITEIGSRSQDYGILLTAQDNQYFNPTTEIDSESTSIIAKVFRFDVESGVGRLRVIESEDMTQGTEYRFEVVGSQAVDPYVDALHSNVKASQVTVLREVIRHPSGTASVAGLQVLGIR